MRDVLSKTILGLVVSVVLSIVLMKLLLGNPADTDSKVYFVGWLSSRVLLFLIVSAAVMLIVSRSVTRPVDWLRSATQKLASGELIARVEQKPDQVRPAIEMEALIKDFNNMAERVEELVRSHRELIANVSHELRSPLARLTLTVDLLRQFPEDREEHLARMENELGKLNGLIERLLTLSRLESYTAPLKEDFFDLADLTAEVIADVQFEAAARGCSVATIRSEECPMVADQALLRAALENIMRNAVQYSDEGTTVLVELGRVQTDSADITVTDKGPGLSEEELSKIFFPFFRGVEAQVRRSSGHGLGLAIASKAINMHGGSLTARSTGSGLAMTIHLPLKSRLA
jgi:two-component system sensor histidine kinase CpxA